jgi:hypothetical protein
MKKVLWSLELLIVIFILTPISLIVYFAFSVLFSLEYTYKSVKTYVNRLSDNNAAR